MKGESKIMPQSQTKPPKAASSDSGEQPSVQADAVKMNVGTKGKVLERALAVLLDRCVEKFERGTVETFRANGSMKQ